MNLKTKWIDILYNVATGSRRVRNFFTPKIKLLFRDKKRNTILFIICLIGPHLCFAQFVFAADNKPPDKAALEADELGMQKLKTEIQKLQAEIKALQISNAQDELFRKKVTAYLGAGSGLAASLIGLLIFFLGRKVSDKISRAQEAKIRQEKEFGREKHNLELFRTLADDNRSIQLAAASVLVQRLDEFKSKENQKKIETAEIRERSTILNVLLSATKESQTGEDLLKLIGDNLVISIGALLPEGTIPSGDTHSPLNSNGMDWQKTRFVKVWWKRLDARNVDFFGAKIEHSGLAEAFLSGAIFLEASLKDTQLRDAKLQRADLRKANLRGANLSGVDLDGAKLEGAIYDHSTKWPQGFDPDAAGAINRDA